MTRKTLLIPFALILISLAIVACAAPAAAPTVAPAAPADTQAPAAAEAPAPVKLTYMVGDVETDQLIAHALVDAYVKEHPNVTIELENRPGGSEGDNVIKTRLATGDMTDLFSYNAGSLIQALNPTSTLVDLTDEPFMANVDDAFKQTVSQNGRVFGTPDQTAMGGGILYNKKIYEDLGLSVPKTWEEFAANNEKIKEAGIAPVIATYGDTWTSQLFVLADSGMAWAPALRKAMSELSTVWNCPSLRFTATSTTGKPRGPRPR